MGQFLDGFATCFWPNCLFKTNVLTVSPTRLQNDWIPLYYFVPVWDLQRNLGDYILHLVQLH